MESQPLKQLYHCTFRLQYHLVVVTKYRRPCITQPMLSRLEAIARATTNYCRWCAAVGLEAVHRTTGSPRVMALRAMRRFTTP
ncbi:transposase [Halorhodospira halochloris]|uniref:transposase n=1 Tax=Halorhodospira halochloris TaxID=1052 RepID=UPI000D6EDA8A